jgi:D-alanyl-D-alanine carboxypeptidase (penicillin-binding protein 5/6)
MKKSVSSIIMLCVIAVFALSVSPLVAASAKNDVAAEAASDPKDASDRTPKIDSATAKSAYMIDFGTGTVLYERDPDKRMPIASMVKIMTLLLTFENIESGRMSFDQKIVISENASGMGGSQMFLDTGLEYPLSDLIKGVVVCSANDASVAIAETISGSVEEFITLMNERARSLGMENTCFVNVTGLPQDGQYCTARDVTTMMRELLKHKDYYRFSGIYMENYTHPDGRVTELVNTNKLVRFYKGCDAGKTGFTNEAMFCLSASALRNGMRVVATVIGAENSKARFAEVSSLFNYAFANYSEDRLVCKDEPIANNIEIRRGKSERIAVAADRDVYVLRKKGDNKEYSVRLDLNDKLKAPVAKGSVIGKLTVTDQNGAIVGTANIVALENIESAGYGDSLKKVLLDWYAAKRKK